MYKKHKIHFVGIGGIGMSGIAQVLLDLGYTVTGSDLRESDITKKLAEKGGIIYAGHAPENVSGADVVVISSAIRDDNPEVQAAKAANIPVIPRAEMLSELMRLKKYGIAVAGTHGKTSTTSMVSSVMQAGKFDPTIIIGGKVNSLKTNAYWGDGEFLVAEADESDGSFLRLCPTICVVTNIDREHMDHYPNMESICSAFEQFISRIPFYGVAILCGDDPHICELLPKIKKRVITYGTSKDVMLEARDIEFIGMGVSYSAYWYGKKLGRVTLRVPGLHHVRNSLAALAVGLELDIPFEKIKKGLSSYTGVGRRFEIVGSERSILVLDDYAHHPTEIKSTLTAARTCWPDNRLVVLFEPHRYSRTKALMDEFTTAFTEADELWITEIYPASESPIVGISGERLARSIQEKRGGPVNYVKSCAALPDFVVPTLKDGDIVITMGAGAIGGTARRILERLKSADNEQAVAL